MKISPIAPNSLPSHNGVNNGQTASAERLAHAHKVASGEIAPDSSMRLTPSDTPVDPQVERINQKKTLKMKTNANPTIYTRDVAGVSADIIDVSAISDPVVEAPVPTQTEAGSEDTKPLSPQFAALAKQRRALQVKERELADREKALDSRVSTPGHDDLIAKLKSQPLSVLQEYGVTYDQLTEAILANNGINPEIASLKAEIKALKEGVDKTFTEKATQEEQAALAAMRREAEALSREGDAYEMVRETNSLSDVMELIHRTYKESGEVLDVTEALQLIEDELISESLKIAKLKKVQGKLTPPPTSTQKQQPQGMRTLTNRDGSTAPLDRKSRAIAAFHGTLKN